LTISWLQRSGKRHLVLVGSSVGASQDVMVEGNGVDELATASHHPDRAGGSTWAARVFQLRTGDSLFDS
jgi:hypothetical protein